ncbi:hypothetical protein CcaCcLH18_05878 [Colletotrichum camelliae]|nr:hypothetical protein CcaCcLH18_05878 [Colletotrichum camelliae]
MRSTVWPSKAATPSNTACVPPRNYMLPEPGMAPKDILNMYIKSTGYISLDASPNVRRALPSHALIRHRTDLRSQQHFGASKVGLVSSACCQDESPAVFFNSTKLANAQRLPSGKLLEAVLADTRLCPQLSSDNEGCNAWTTLIDDTPALLLTWAVESSFNSSVRHCRVANIPSVRGNVPGSSAFCAPVPGAMSHGHSSAATLTRL